jgi:hypothetical protein
LVVRSWLVVARCCLRPAFTFIIVVIMQSEQRGQKLHEIKRTINHEEDPRMQYRARSVTQWPGLR